MATPYISASALQGDRILGKEEMEAISLIFNCFALQAAYILLLSVCWVELFQ